MSDTTLTACPCCDESVSILSAADFNSTTITLSACKYADTTAESLVWKKSAVLKAEIDYQKSMEGWDWD